MDTMLGTQLRQRQIATDRFHLRDFIDAYNYGRRLKALRGLTPHEYICKRWENEPERFTLNPHHQNPGPNT